jgi:formylglycine-generating enzyme required for sulfatase activity
VGIKLLPKYAWFWDNADDLIEHHRNRAWPVGMKKPNDYGLFDMLGNAWQWCDNVFAPYSGLEEAGTNVEAWDKVGRVLHGGSYDSLAWDVRSAFRVSSVPTDNNVSYGFRVARTCP